jgi:hypothetical protein
VAAVFGRSTNVSSLSASPPASFVFAEFLSLCTLSGERQQWQVNNAGFGGEFLI